ncbi:MAG: type II toxin-antitoxin system VapC family toxin [Betaproteobacteria bacterium]
MVVVDTHVLIHDALEPRRLSARARRVLGGERGPLAISDISLWEIGMLIAKGRVEPGADAAQFIEDIVDARALRVLAITPRIAVLAQSDAFSHGDPADRIIAATALAHRAPLLTADAALRRMETIETLW